MLGKANGSAVALVIGAALFVLVNVLAIGTWVSPSAHDAPSRATRRRRSVFPLPATPYDEHCILPGAFR